jgi:hypothetical protein
MNSNQTMAATYAFAAPSSAKYLTQFIDAHISWVNHIPNQMLSKSTPNNSKQHHEIYNIH